MEKRKKEVEEEGLEAPELSKRFRWLVATFGKVEGERKFQREQEEKKILFA